MLLHGEVNPGTDFPLTFKSCMLPSELIPLFVEVSAL